MSSIEKSSLFERLGGEAVLRNILREFVDLIVQDIMIGFHFQSVDVERLWEMEYQFAARHLGGSVRYQGRSIQEAHAKHRIFGGQFNRRLQILKNVLKKHQVAPDIVEHWVRHTEALRPLVTASNDPCEPALPNLSKSSG